MSVANFFFIAAFSLVITAQWELSTGNGFAYTAFSTRGFGALLTSAFGVATAYGGSDTAQYHNAVGFFMILWTIYVFTLLIASLPTNVAYILVFFLVDLGFLNVAASYFASADGHAAAATALKKSGGVSCFLAGLVDTAEAWLARASEVAEVLGQDAAQRDQENKSPRAEITLLKHSGLLKLLGPKMYGGGEQPWSAGYQAIREDAKVDGSIGMLLGYHLLWSTTANVVGSPKQIERIHELIITNNYFVGGAVNPRDSDLKIVSDGDQIVFNETNFFNTGSVVSDLTVLEGVLEGTDSHIFALAPTKQEGMVFAHNWHNNGLRLTESGSVKMNNIRPREDVLAGAFPTLLLPTIQLVFSNFYLGIAFGALEFASKYTTAITRAWPFGGDNKASATDEFCILERYGNFFAHLRATEALADRAGDRLSAIYSKYQSNRLALTPEERGDVAEWIASVKVVTTDVGLRVTSGVFEVTGARATSLKVGLDRFWRDIRTHTLHDQLAYKNRELGRYVLLHEYPAPSWFTQEWGVFGGGK
ncbi:thermophilic desulfurizing enzyme family protein [Penicillium maclennaniae]|uniref:thermophilic desulfurizing enzyme family protein n=1 Tax=Penicillium maclennaniae TaxID=1343394 RepID=UPI00253F9253|nr:thermophilic desulfurizing enzyme family protein [Penicillium maclennaniae]KAJ5681557.1 thermophilic desulfurizing enzyme family protein [Penicillium maclennaniae]